MSTDVGVQVPPRAQIAVIGDTFSCRVFECTRTHGRGYVYTNVDLGKPALRRPLGPDLNSREETVTPGGGR